MTVPVRVLFVCVGNSCRSQMAEALAQHHYSEVVIPSSAGISPLGRIADSTRKVLLERGIRIAGQFSKDLNDHTLLLPPDLIVNMTGIPGKSLFAGRRVEDWDVEDPFGEDMETYRRICDDIEARLADLAARLRARRRGAGQS
jgi:arsenate reductase